MKRTLAVALVVFGGTFSAPAVACLCSCSSEDEDAAAIEVPAEYRQIFSGLVVSTERVNEPVGPIEVTNEDVVVSPGYWVKSQVLVLRIWRGTPSPVAEVWTPVLSDCETPPIPGFPFVALVRTEKGRSVAESSYCDCDLKAAATKGPATFTATGIPVVATAIGAAVIALFLLIRRARASR